MTLSLKTLCTAAALAAAAPACSPSKASPPPAAATPAAPADDEIALALMEHHRFHHHGGITLFIALGLDTLGIPEDRRAAVEAVRNDLLASLEPGRLAEQAFIGKLADGVAAGSIDGTAVDAAIVPLRTEARTVFDRSAGALNRLHALLLAPERAALVDKVNAHWVVWQDVNAEETSASPREEGHLASLQAQLVLTQFEVDRIREALARQRASAFDTNEVDAEIRAFDSAFVSDRFDARALAASDANAHMVAWAAEHLADFLRAATPSLTPEQRSALADRLRGHAAHNPTAEGAP